MNETEGRAFADILVSCKISSISIVAQEDGYNTPKKVQSNHVLVGVSTAIETGAKISEVGYTFAPSS